MCVSLSSGIFVISWRDRQRLWTYRVYPHLTSTSDLHITVLWSTIKSLIESGRLTSKMVLLIQSDGGSEFTSQAIYQFCAWLVQKQYCRAVRCQWVEIK